MPWEVELYEDQKGSCPVEEFLDSLPDKYLGKVLQTMNSARRERHDEKE